MLLLYTDGLIERRDDDVDAGLERLRVAFAEAPAGAEECLRWLGERFSADAIPDDVAMLAMARRAARVRLAPRQHAGISTVRHDRRGAPSPDSP